MMVARWISACVLWGLAGWLTCLNWYPVVRYVFTRRRGPSWIPLLGGIAGAAGTLLCPEVTVQRFWWLPLLVDWGCVPGLLFTGVSLLLRKRET